MMTEETGEKHKGPADAGASLKAARLKKGLKQEDIAKALRIPTWQVSALEHNRREEFPAAVYYRGALQSYCEYLDLDFVTLWRQLNPPAPQPAPPAKAVQPPPPPRKPILSVPKLAPSLLVPAGIFGGLLFAAGIFWFVTQQPFDATQGRPPGSPQARAPVAPPKAPEPQPAAPPPKAGTHVLRIEPTDDAWVRLRVDRQLLFEGNLPAGRSNTWEGHRSFGLRTPREGSLRVWLDGQPVDLSTLPRDTYGNILIQPDGGEAPASRTTEEKPAETPPQSAPPLIP